MNSPAYKSILLILLFFLTAFNSYCYRCIHAPFEKDSLEVCLKTARDTNRVIILNKLSFQHLQTSDYKWAIALAREARRLSLQLKYRKGEAKSYINIGNVYMAQSQLDTAKACYLKSLVIAKSIHNLLIESHCTNNLGELYRHQANYEKALYYYFQSVKVCALRNDKEGESGTLNNSYGTNQVNLWPVSLLTTFSVESTSKFK